MGAFLPVTLCRQMLSILQSRNQNDLSKVGTIQGRIAYQWLFDKINWTAELVRGNRSTDDDLSDSWWVALNHFGQCITWISSSLRCHSLCCVHYWPCLEIGTGIDRPILWHDSSCLSRLSGITGASFRRVGSSETNCHTEYLNLNGIVIWY